MYSRDMATLSTFTGQMRHLLQGSINDLSDKQTQEIVLNIGRTISIRRQMRSDKAMRKVREHTNPESNSNFLQYHSCNGIVIQASPQPLTLSLTCIHLMFLVCCVFTLSWLFLSLLLGACAANVRRILWVTISMACTTPFRRPCRKGLTLGLCALTQNPDPDLPIAQIRYTHLGGVTTLSTQDHISWDDQVRFLS